MKKSISTALTSAVMAALVFFSVPPGSASAQEGAGKIVIDTEFKELTLKRTVEATLVVLDSSPHVKSSADINEQLAAGCSFKSRDKKAIRRLLDILSVEWLPASESKGADFVVANVVYLKSETNTTVRYLIPRPSENGKLRGLAFYDSVARTAPFVAKPGVLDELKAWAHSVTGSDAHADASTASCAAM